MSRRRRLLSTALALTMLGASCAGDDDVDATSARATSTPALTSTPTPSTTSTTTTSTTTTTTTSSTTTSTTTTVAPCGKVTVVVLGNSTDFWPNLFVGLDEPTPDAWPGLLDERLAADHPELPADVRNEAGRGAGHDTGFQGVASMTRLLEAIVEEGVERPAVLVVAPSVVDLQLKALDVDDSFAALLRIVEQGRSAFDDVLVAPMHPVDRRQGEATAVAVAEFNRRLVDTGLTSGYDRSPLLADDELWARPELYDDFDDERLDTDGPDPDGIHPDVEGHEAVAEAITPFVASAIAGICRT